MATIHHQVWIEAPPTKVYEALSTAEGLGNWWAPHTSTGWDEESEYFGFCTYAWGLTLLMLKDWCEGRRVSK